MMKLSLLLLLLSFYSSLYDAQRLGRLWFDVEGDDSYKNIGQIPTNYNPGAFVDGAIKTSMGLVKENGQHFFGTFIFADYKRKEGRYCVYYAHFTSLHWNCEQYSVYTRDYFNIVQYSGIPDFDSAKYFQSDRRVMVTSKEINSNRTTFLDNGWYDPISDTVNLAHWDLYTNKHGKFVYKQYKLNESLNEYETYFYRLKPEDY